MSLPVPEETPISIRQQINDLRCPPPLLPSTQTADLKSQQMAIKKISDSIELLEKQVDDLEKRYVISFFAKAKPKFDLANNEIAKIDISGTVNNIILDFHLQSARQGNEGPAGRPGDQGPQGKMGVKGPQGKSGYFGEKGGCL